MIRLSVNVNKVATLRNARGGDRPSVRQAAEVAIAAGCHGITVHPRPDGRHIRRADVLELASWLPVELNIEGYPGPEWIELVESLHPAQATLVPDPPDALTSNAGWDLRADRRELHRLTAIVARLKTAGCRISLFIDPDPEQALRASDLGADRVELYTEPYARAFPTPERPHVFARYRRTAEAALEAGLGINAGHDLDLENLPFLAENLPGLQEVSIGHALIADALVMGLERAVKAYLAALPPAA